MTEASLSSCLCGTKWWKSGHQVVEGNFPFQNIRNSKHQGSSIGKLFEGRKTLINMCNNDVPKVLVEHGIQSRLMKSPSTLSTQSISSLILCSTEPSPNRLCRFQFKGHNKKI